MKTQKAHMNTAWSRYCRYQVSHQHFSFGSIGYILILKYETLSNKNSSNLVSLIDRWGVLWGSCWSVREWFHPTPWCEPVCEQRWHLGGWRSRIHRQGGTSVLVLPRKKDGISGSHRLLLHYGVVPKPPTLGFRWGTPGSFLGAFCLCIPHLHLPLQTIFNCNLIDQISQISCYLFLIFIVLNLSSQ